MHDPIAAGRRAALRAVAIQAGAVALVAAAFLTQGVSHAVAAGVGGASLVLGNALAARIALRGIAPAGVSLLRLFGGLVSRWVSVVVLCGLGAAIWRLPPAPILAGILVAFVTHFAAMSLRPHRHLHSQRPGNHG